MDALAEKQHAHELLDHLDAGQFSGVVRLLESLTATAPSYTIANAPVDDEPYPDDERQAVADSVEWLKHNFPHSTRTGFGRVGV